MIMCIWVWFLTTMEPLTKQLRDFMILLIEQCLKLLRKVEQCVLILIHNLCSLILWLHQYYFMVAKYGAIQTATSLKSFT